MNSPLTRLATLLLLWGGAAALAGAFELLVHVPLPVVPLLIVSLTAAFSVGLARVGWLRDAAATVSVRAILTAHLVRFVGIYFLWLHALGRLPAEFAQRAGWGDIVAATGALGLLFWPNGPGFRRVFFWWNIIGAADVFLAAGTGAWLNLTRPGSMNELAVLPLTLVPLWLVPVLLSSHFYLIRQHFAVRSPSSCS